MNIQIYILVSYFCSYLNRVYKPEEAPVTDIGIKSFDQLNDARVLGESVLARHPIISASIPAEKAKKFLTRGMVVVVHEILEKTFERLRTEDPRQKVASEWWLCNILYYRYSGGWRSITHRWIAARSAMNERRYYWKLKNAITTYWNMLLEMIIQEDPPLVAAQEKMECAQCFGQKSSRKIECSDLETAIAGGGRFPGSNCG
jgi:hypothetical protein